MSSIDEADSVFEADFGSRSFRVPVKRLDVDLGKVGATTSNMSEVGKRALTQNASPVVDNSRATTSLDSPVRRFSRSTRYTLCGPVPETNRASAAYSAYPNRPAVVGVSAPATGCTSATIPDEPSGAISTADTRPAVFSTT